MKVTVLQDIMSANDQIAAKNEELLRTKGVLDVNVMSSPGAGKTTLILETIRRQRDRTRMAVIEGDIVSTVDAKTFRPPVSGRASEYAVLFRRRPEPTISVRGKPQ